MNCKITLFADDTSVAIKAQSFDELQQMGELQVQSFVDWCHSNASIINISKTECIYFVLSSNDRRLIIQNTMHLILCNQQNKKVLFITISYKYVLWIGVQCPFLYHYVVGKFYRSQQSFHSPKTDFAFDFSHCSQILLQTCVF